MMSAVYCRLIGVRENCSVKRFLDYVQTKESMALWIILLGIASPIHIARERTKIPV